MERKWAQPLSAFALALALSGCKNALQTKFVAADAVSTPSGNSYHSLDQWQEKATFYDNPIVGPLDADGHPQTYVDYYKAQQTAASQPIDPAVESNGYSMTTGYHAWTGDGVLLGAGVNWGIFLCDWPPSFQGRYFDTTSNQWSFISTTDEPYRTYEGISAWTGDKWFVWGGFRGCKVPPENTTSTATDPGDYNQRKDLIETQQAELYSLANNTWESLTDLSAPIVHLTHSDAGAIAHPDWEPRGGMEAKAAYFAPTDSTIPATEGEVFIWGGLTNTVDSAGHLMTNDTWGSAWAVALDDTYTRIPNSKILWSTFTTPNFRIVGHRYNLHTQTWSIATPAGAPSGRSYFGFANNSNSAFVWGGNNSGAFWAPNESQVLGDGKIYDIRNNLWVSVPKNDDLGARTVPQVAWDASHSLWIVMGGTQVIGSSDTGNRMEIPMCDGAAYNQSTREWQYIEPIPNCDQIYKVIYNTGSKSIVVFYKSNNQANNGDIAVVRAVDDQYNFESGNATGLANKFIEFAQDIGSKIVLWGLQGGTAPLNNSAIYYTP